MRHYVRWGSVSLFYETTTLINFCSYELMRRCVSRWQSERCSSALGSCGRYLLGFLFHLRFLIVFTHNYQHRRGSLTLHIAPDLQDSLLADATRRLAPGHRVPYLGVKCRASAAASRLIPRAWRS